MTVVRKTLLVGLGFAAAGWLVWFGLVLKSAGDDVAYRERLAEEGARTAARVIEEGVAREDGGYAQAWVETANGKRAFVDLSNSRMAVFRLGDQLTVVLPPSNTDRDVALPVDVVEASPASVYWSRLWIPGVAGLVLVTAGVSAFLVGRTERGAAKGGPG
jgi:hypothetical protein